MLKILALSLTSLVFLSSCVPASSGGGSGPTTAYSSCESLPFDTPVEQNPCPGSSGTWNSYLIEKDNTGAIISYELWCGGTEQDHPTTQIDYDNMSPLGNTSNNDFKMGSDCASGSSRDSSSYTTTNIWQKVP